MARVFRLYQNELNCAELSGAECLLQSTDAVSGRLGSAVSSRRVERGRQRPATTAERRAETAQPRQSRRQRQPHRPAARQARQDGGVAVPQHRRQRHHAVAGQLCQTAGESRGRPAL